MRSLFWVGTCSLLTALAATAAGATTALQLDLPELTNRADRILVGTAATSYSAWHEGSLVTLVTLEVEETLKGKTTTHVTILLPGGIDAQRAVPVATVWPGQPSISVGERVLLFLRRTEETEESYAILGFSQGLFTLATGAGGGEVALRDLRGLSLAGADGISRGGRERLPLVSLRAEIERLLTARAGGNG